MITVSPKVVSFAAWLIVALTLGGCQSTLQPDAAIARAPFAVDARGRILVDLLINGRGPLPFVVDSAASISAVYENQLAILQLPLDGNEVTVHGLSASGARPVTTVATVELGKARWKRVPMVALPTPPADNLIERPPVGILGHDLLVEYGVAFEIATRTVRLYTRDAMARRNYAGWSTVPLSQGAPDTPAGSIYFFDVALEGHTARAVFDLGSGVNVVNWQTARAVGLSPADYPPRRAAAIDGIYTRTSSLPRFIAGHISTGPVSWHEEIFSIADVDIFATLSVDNAPAALIGAGLFLQRDFVIDFARSRILIRRGEEISPPLP